MVTPRGLAVEVSGGDGGKRRGWSGLTFPPLLAVPHLHSESPHTLALRRVTVQSLPGREDGKGVTTRDKRLKKLTRKTHPFSPVSWIFSRVSSSSHTVSFLQCTSLSCASLVLTGFHFDSEEVCCQLRILPRSSILYYLAPLGSETIGSYCSPRGE